jgi:hypothetical protein
MTVQDTTDRPTRARRARAMAITVACALMALELIAPLAAAEGGEGNLPRYWEVHAVLLSLATGLFVLSYLALWLKHLKRLEPLGVPGTKGLAKLWLRAHMWLGIAGVALAVAGIVWGYVMVDWAFAGTHFRRPHAWVGFATLALVLPPLVTGVAWRRVRRSKVAVKWWHLLAGVITGWALE